MNRMLIVEDVVKTFGGLYAVDGVSFEVDEGSFTALLGPNGSGKSTTLKICTNLFQPDSGRIIIDGIDVQDDAIGAMSGVGCVIETPEIYPDVTGRRYLEYLAKISGMTSESAASEANRVMEVVGMSEYADRKVRGYSKGMRQRAVLAQSLLGDPSMLILDEPTSGLDPRGSAEFGRILHDLNSQGKTILMSSHRLHEVETLCDSAVIINRGMVVKQGTIDDIVRLSTITISAIGGVSNGIVSMVSRLPGVIEASAIDEGIAIKMDGGPDEQADIVAALISSGVRIYSVRKDDPLEEAFTDIIGGGGQ